MKPTVHLHFHDVDSFRSLLNVTFFDGNVIIPRIGEKITNVEGIVRHVKDVKYDYKKEEVFVNITVGNED